MNSDNLKQLVIAAAVAVTASASAKAQLFITEVAPWASTAANAAYAADWFELTNPGASAVDITGWKMDDNTDSFASSVALSGITSIAAGKSVVFIDITGSNLATKSTGFVNAWFGGTAPAGFQIGGYGGTSVGLSTGGDAVNIFTGLGTLVARVDFGAADAVSPLQTFDNTAALNSVTLSTLSIVGVNGAFTATDGIEVGSPGVTPVPEPSEYAAAFGLVALGAAVWIRRQRR
jgi:MYXO-CTERM domain-containing protein